MIESWFNQDLQEAVHVRYLDGNVFSLDNNGNKVGVNVTNGGEPVTLSGSISANVIRSDGGTVAVSGSSSGNSAWVVLPQACYAIPGVISVVIKNTVGSDVTTICAVVGNVYQSSTDTPVDPGTIIPSIQTLITSIETAVSSIPADYSSLWTSIAPAFDSTKMYAAGQYVTYNGGVYRFTKAHSGSWAAADVTAVNIGGELTDAKNAVREFNAYNYLMDCAPSVAGSTNVTFAATGDGGVKVNGTAGGSGSFYNYYVATTGGLPPFFKNGKKYIAKYSSTNVELCVWFYKNGTYQTGLTRKTGGEILVPSDSNGCVIRLRVTSGVTANETVYPVIIDCMTNQEMTDILNNAPTSTGKMLSVGNSILTGSVYTNGVYSYLCEYDDAPYAQIAKRLEISKNNVDHRLYSNAGLIAENSSNYSFLNVIKAISLADFDYVLTHLWIADMNGYQLGTVNATSGDGTIAGAVVELVNYVNSSNEKARLILVSVPPVSTSNKGASVFTGNFTNTKSIKDLDELMLLLAKKYQFMYLDWQMLNISYSWDNYRSSATDVHASSPDTYRIMGEYLAARIGYNNAEFFADTYGVLHGESVSGTGNPVVLHGTKAASKIESILIEDATAGDIISISGKNIFFMASDMQQRINNGVTYQFSNQQIAVSSEGATGNSVSSGDNFNTKYQKVNGVTWWHNYKFMVSNDTIVTVSLNASEELLYDSLIQGQVSDGTNNLYVDGNGLTFVAKANTEYGFRLLVQTGFTGSITFKPQIEFSAYATAYEKFKGARNTISGNGTFYDTPYSVQEETAVVFIHSGTANFTISVAGMNTEEKADFASGEAETFVALTFGKTPFSKDRKPLISFIDDDTSTVALVERYHDIFAAENVVGGYAVMTKNLDEQTGLAAKLLDYEQEGFSCLYHCYYQSGDATRYWESGNQAYDKDLIRENFMRGLRDMQEFGFSAYKYWVTPYGVGDEFIQSLAKTHDMPCLFVMGGSMTDNSFVNINGNCNRYGIPRISVSTSSVQSRTKQIIDACIAAKGWLTIVTHANTWGSGTTMDDKLTEIIQYCKTNGAEIVSVPEAFNEFKPYFYWSELLG